MIEAALSRVRIIAREAAGADEVDRLLLYVGGAGARVCVIRDNQALEPRDRMLGELRELREVIELDRVFPNPKVSDIMAMADALAGKGIDTVVGIGGGSTLDSAKAVAAVLSNGGDLDEYLGPGATRKIGRRDVKLILAPTTAGTGSEVTQFGVYTARSGRKYTLKSPFLEPDVALLAAAWTHGLPAAITAATAFDALSHALETLWNRNATPVSDRAATEAAAAVLRAMERAYDNAVSGGTDGRAAMLEAAAMAGVAFNMTGTAAVHALSFIFSEEWHVPHGTACAFTLEDVLRFNLRDGGTRRKLAEVARRVFGDGGADDALVERLDARIVALKRKMGLPMRLADLGIRLGEGDIERLFLKSLDDPKMANNAAPVAADDVVALIRAKAA